VENSGFNSKWGKMSGSGNRRHADIRKECKSISSYRRGTIKNLESWKIVGLIVNGGK
jgi:hypothetical protein